MAKVWLNSTADYILHDTETNLWYNDDGQSNPGPYTTIKELELNRMSEWIIKSYNPSTGIVSSTKRECLYKEALEDGDIVEEAL